MISSYTQAWIKRVLIVQQPMQPVLADARINNNAVTICLLYFP
jgi:hypothetical protein